jgi:predicted DsbA family dithiol-disulfide isomerase
MENIIKVEIWSDIRCPFCYLGKRRFEAALDQFPDKSQVKVEWHSFQLDPYLITQPGISVYDHLAELKGISREQSVSAHEQIVIQAKQFGLSYNFDKAVVANSFNAHRLAHMAKANNLSDAMEERLFKAYFTNGENIDDTDTLVNIGKEVGLPVDEVEKMLHSEDFTDNVLMDDTYARELGIRAVPYFLFNGKLSVPGAQSPDIFLRALIKSLETPESPEKQEEKSKKYFFRNF